MKRLFSMLLALTMVLSAIPFAAFADGSDSEGTTGIKMVLDADSIFAAKTEEATEPVEETVLEEETAPIDETETAEEAETIAATEVPETTEPAREVESFEIPFTVNPVYEGIYTEADFPRTEKSNSAFDEDQDHSDLDFWQENELLLAPAFLTIEEATAQLKQNMVNRKESFTLYFKSSTNDYNKVLSDMLLAAVEHTGNPKEGDYLQWHFGGWGGTVDRVREDGMWNFTFNAEVAYFTTAQQEGALDNTVKGLIQTLGVKDKSEYEKIKAVYDYICQNITYDYANLEDDTYLLKHSAYAALVNKTAVCQGYATLFYRLMLELGIDCRVIPGIDEEGYGHAWNIVKIGDVYYNLDATWDAGYDEYYWFLCNTINFPYHYRYMEYATTQFHTDYPMAAENYTEGSEGVTDEYMVIGVCGDQVAFGIDRQRNLVIAGIGPMWDYESITSGNEANYPPWYYWMDAFDHVIIEEGVTTIGNYAFGNMSNIVGISIPDTLTGIGDGAFQNWKTLETFVLPTALEYIGANAFNKCSNLSEILIPNGVKTIGNGAFLSCSSLNNVIFNENLVSIGDQAFQYTALTEVVLPDELKTLGASAFANCSQLTSISLGNSLQSIGSSAFYYCNQVTEIILPDTLESIGSNAFQYCGITGITIPDSVTSLGTGVFSYCYYLKSVVWNNVLTVIPDDTFHGCSSLTSFNIPAHVTEIHYNAFANTGLKEIIIPDTVEYVGVGAFVGCSQMQYAKLSSQLTIIADDLFASCSQLSDVEIPVSVERIGKRAFSYCASLAILVLPDNVRQIDESAFNKCISLQEIVLPEGLGYINKNAFAFCSGVKQIKLPENLTSLSDSAFYGCSGLTEIVIPNQIATISDSVFAACSNLVNVTLPESVVWIKDSAFNGCAKLGSITIPAGVQEVGRYAFRDCDALKEIIFLGDAPKFGSTAFMNVTATAYYPIGNETWTEYVCGDYTGTITWVEQCVSHEFSSVEVIAPTCTEGGYTRHFCPVCKQGYTTDETEKLGHDLSDWVVDVEETCTTDGSRSRVCQREGCDFSETEVIGATGHSHVPAVTAPTCTEGGYTTYTCHCGDSYVTDETAALGHDVTYAVETAPTLEAEGKLAGSCTRCGEKLTVTLPKLGKTAYTLEVITEPTKEAEGFGKYTWNVADYGTFTFEAPIPNVILGDVNDDGEINVLDLMYLANFFAKGEIISEKNADVNADGLLDVRDLMFLANVFAGKETLG